jgi:SH3 domain protein
MKCVAAFYVTCFLLAAQLSYGEAIYVTDSFRVMVRTTPSSNAKIVAMPKSGTPLELLDEKGDEWSHVRLPDGKEGWALSRYMTSEIPSRVTVDQLRQKNSTLESRAKASTDENKKLTVQRDELQSAVSELKSAFDDVSNRYRTLTEESSGSTGQKGRQNHRSRSDPLVPVHNTPLYILPVFPT